MDSTTTSPPSAGLRDPRWLLAGHLLPASLVLAFYWNAHRLIGSMLSAEQLELWRTLGAVLLITNGAVAVTMVLRWRDRRPVPWPLALVSLIVHCTLCVYTFFNANGFIPWDIPRWMLPRDLFTVTNALLMVPILHSILLLIERTVSTHARSWPNFLVAVGMGVAWYLIFLVIDSLPYEWRIREQVAVPIMVLATVSFFFFLVRGLMLLVRKQEGRWSEHSLPWRMVIGLALPLTGLIVHHGLFGRDRIGAPIGDFSHPWFYIVAVLNGIVLCVKPPVDPRLRSGLQFLRAVGFSYVLYFALVFLPWLPISFLLIIAFGIGFLMMAPTALFIVQLGDIIREHRWVSASVGRWSSTGIIVLGLLVIPGCIWLNNARDRHILEDALTYVYAPDLEQDGTPDLDAADVARMLERVRLHKRGSGRNELGLGNEAILGTWYDLQVFDGVTLSEEKTQELARVFTDEEVEGRFRMWWRSSPRNEGTELTGLTAHSTRDKASGMWRTRVELAMHNGPDWQAEYGTTFHLPPGAYITDHWLMIGDRKAQGILADRKAATWIYQQITTRERRDPSLLRYVAPHRLELRVFPFGPNETRHTGFEVVTCEPLPLTIDGHTVLLGDTNIASNTAVQETVDAALHYVPARVKAGLPKVQAPTALWVLFDRSADALDAEASLIARTHGLLNDPRFASVTKHFVAVNSGSHPLPEAGWPEALGQVKAQGGCFVGRAIERIALSYALTSATEVPFIVLVSDSADQAVVTDNTSQLAAIAHVPTSWYALDMEGRLRPAGGAAGDSANTAVQVNDVLRAPRCRYETKGRTFLLPDDGEPSLVWMGSNVDKGLPNSSPAKDEWHAGLQLDAADARLRMRPAIELEQPHQLTRRSFAAGILSQATAFICLETEAQEIALREKQEEVLKASSLFDAGDELKPMSEPAEWFALIALALILFARWWSRSR